MINQVLYNSKFGNYYSHLRPYVTLMKVSLTDENYSLECEDSFVSSNQIGIFSGFPGNFNNLDELILGFNSSNGIIKIDGKITYIIIDGNINPFIENKFDFESAIMKFSADLALARIISQETSISTDIQSNTLNYESEFNSDFVDEFNSDIIGEPGKFNSDIIGEPGKFIGEPGKFIGAHEKCYYHNNLTNMNFHKIMPQCTSVCVNIDSHTIFSFENNFNNSICGKFSGEPGKCYYPNNSTSYQRIYGSGYASGYVTLNGLFKFSYHLSNGIVQEI